VWLTAAGEAWCWGANQFGELGDGTTNNSAVPVRVQADVPFSSIETGYFHSCGIAVTGESSPTSSR
jgi:alpha-tubulin suppressor-like RCC1 family protein